MDEQKLEEVKKALFDAGKSLKDDIWRDDDSAFLAARAKDLVGLNAKASATNDPHKKAAYVAAAKDVLNHVKLYALIRLEDAQRHLLDQIGNVFLEKVVPLLLRILPGLVGL